MRYQITVLCLIPWHFVYTHTRNGNNFSSSVEPYSLIPKKVQIQILIWHFLWIKLFVIFFENNLLLTGKMYLFYKRIFSFWMQIYWRCNPDPHFFFADLNGNILSEGSVSTTLNFWTHFLESSEQKNLAHFERNIYFPSCFITSVPCPKCILIPNPWKCVNSKYQKSVELGEGRGSDTTTQKIYIL